MTAGDRHRKSQSSGPGEQAESGFLSADFTP